MTRTPIAAAAIMARQLRRQRTVEALNAYLFLIPVLIGLFVFTLGPIFYSLYISLTEWDLLKAPMWRGFDNYARLVHDAVFQKCLLNTAYFTLVGVPVIVVLSMLLAIVMNQRLRGQTFLRTVFFLPSVSSTVAMALLWAWIYQPQFGILNYLLGLVGLGGVNWLGSPQWAMPSVILMALWRSVGYDMVLFLAGLQAIPAEFYEAAEVDGANRWQQFRHVTVPLLSPTTFFVLILEVIGSLQVFQQIYVMTRGGPMQATITIVYYIYMNGWMYFKMGKASAIAWVLFLLIGAFTYIQFRLQKRWVYYDL